VRPLAAATRSARVAGSAAEMLQRSKHQDHFELQQALYVCSCMVYAQSATCSRSWYSTVALCCACFVSPRSNTCGACAAVAQSRGFQLCSLLLSVRRVMEACWMTVVASTTMPSPRRNSCRTWCIKEQRCINVAQKKSKRQQHPWEFAGRSRACRTAGGWAADGRVPCMAHACTCGRNSIAC
jgi:hypothetical protein